MVAREPAPSPTMLKALRMALNEGLERRKGGFWTYPGCPERRVERDVAPETWVEIRTIDACVKRGWLAREGTNYDSPARLTEEGRALARP